MDNSGLKIRVKEYIREKKLVLPGEHIIAAVSGGADSVCLLLLLDSMREELAVTLEAVHVEHGIRGAESRRDAEFVRQLCQKRRIPCRVVPVDAKALAAQEGDSLEEAARILRYRALRRRAAECAKMRNAAGCADGQGTVKCAGEKSTQDCINMRNTVGCANGQGTVKCAGEKSTQDCANMRNAAECADGQGTVKCAGAKSLHDCANMRSTAECADGQNAAGCTGGQDAAGCTGVKIAVAHNREDQAETVLFHLLRGSSLAGAAGMKPMQDDVIRPLLEIPRRDIEAYLGHCGQAYCVDSTNAQLDYARNRLRHQVMPLLAQINVRAVDHICRLGEEAGQADAYIASQAVAALECCRAADEGEVRTAARPGEPKPAALPGEPKNAPAVGDGEAHPLRLSVEKLLGYPELVRNKVVYLALSEYAGSAKDITQAHVGQVLSLTKKQTGKMVSLPYRMCARRQYGELVLWKEPGPPAPPAPRKTENARANAGSLCSSEENARANAGSVCGSAGNTGSVCGSAGNAGNAGSVCGSGENARAAFCVDLKAPGRFPLADGRVLELEILDYDGKTQKIPRNYCKKWFDYDIISHNLQLRNRRAGDYLTVTENGNTKKLKSFFIDEKIPRQIRGGIPLVAAGAHILWVIGFRGGQFAQVTADTKKILEMRVSGGEKNG